MLICVVLFRHLAVFLHSKYHCSDLAADSNRNQRQIFPKMSRSLQIVVMHETNGAAQAVSSQILFAI